MNNILLIQDNMWLVIMRLDTGQKDFKIIALQFLNIINPSPFDIFKFISKKLSQNQI